MDQARVRHLQGLVGDYSLHSLHSLHSLQRAYDRCAACGHGHAPLEAHLGLGAGAGTLSPGLARVVCRDGIEGSFEDTVERVAEAVGVWPRRWASR